MTDQHPITPPPELVHQWANMLASGSGQAVFAMAAQWGSDQELEACIDVLGGQWEWDILSQCTGWKEFRDQSEEILRAARRPKPPSLKEQALAALQEAAYMADDAPPQGICSDQIDIIRKALEQLND